MENEGKDNINNSKSATVLKTIYTILIVVILINCIILIASILLKTDDGPVMSKQQVVLKDKDKKEVLEDVEDIEGIEDDVLSDLEKKALEHDLEP